LEELGWKKVGRTRTLAAPIFTLDAHWRIEWKRWVFDPLMQIGLKPNIIDSWATASVIKEAHQRWLKTTHEGANPSRGFVLLTRGGVKMKKQAALEGFKDAGCLKELSSGPIKLMVLGSIAICKRKQLYMEKM